jgi:hypothetical protein
LTLEQNTLLLAHKTKKEKCLLSNDNNSFFLYHSPKGLSVSVLLTCGYTGGFAVREIKQTASTTLPMLTLALILTHADTRSGFPLSTTKNL